MCDCLEQANEMLATHGAVINATISLTASAPRKAALEILDAKTRKPLKGIGMVAAFCPFCGEEYEPEDQGDGTTEEGLDFAFTPDVLPSAKGSNR